MGRLYAFVCDDCGYEAEVAGGGDAGMSGVRKTMSCADCRQLVDVLVALVEPVLKSVERPACPICNGVRISPWGDADHPGPPLPGVAWGSCPRCSGSMRSDGELRLLWD